MQTETPLAKVERLRQERQELVERMKRIPDRADSESRDLYPDERQRFDRLERDFKELSDEIAALERQHDLGPRLTRAASAGGSALTSPGGGGGRLRSRFVHGTEERMLDWQLARAPSHSYNADEIREFSLGRAVRGMVTGNWEDAELERRALSEGTDSAGGFAVPSVLATTIIDRVRKQARVLQAGATTVPMGSDEHAIPRLAAGVTGAWRNENAVVTESDPTFERVTFTARTLAVITKMSYELVEDITPAAADAIENELSQALSLELDRVALRGTGTAPEPRGIKNQSGVELQSLGANGATPTMDNLTTAVYGVRKDNIEPNAILWSSRTGETYSKLKDTTNQPLNYAPEVAGLSRLDTNQIPDNVTQGTSTDTSEIYVGRWSDLLIGVRPSIGVRVQRLSEAFAASMQVALCPR